MTVAEQEGHAGSRPGAMLQTLKGGFDSARNCPLVDPEQLSLRHLHELLPIRIRDQLARHITKVRARSLSIHRPAHDITDDIAQEVHDSASGTDPAPRAIAAPLRNAPRIAHRPKGTRRAARQCRCAQLTTPSVARVYRSPGTSVNESGARLAWMNGMLAASRDTRLFTSSNG